MAGIYIIRHIQSIIYSAVILSQIYTIDPRDTPGQNGMGPSYNHKVNKHEVRRENEKNNGSSDGQTPCCLKQSVQNHVQWVLDSECMGDLITAFLTFLLIQLNSFYTNWDWKTQC